jgi:hypothetical protein
MVSNCPNPYVCTAGSGDLLPLATLVNNLLSRCTGAGGPCGQQAGTTPPAGQPAGRCLRAGTPSLNGSGSSFSRIEERQLCQGVYTHPGARSELAEIIKQNPERWKVLRARLEERDENAIEATLLRHVNELAVQKAVPGGMVYLELPEMEIFGWARVLAIDPCPEVIETEGKLVTGTFKHERGIIVEIHIEGEPNPLGITPGHLVWSADRENWVHAQDLREGERLLGMDSGTPRIECLALCAKPESVYNIEVEGDHCYRVGEQGLLVHNTSDVFITSGNQVTNGVGNEFAQPAQQYRIRRRRQDQDFLRGGKNLGAVVIGFVAQQGENRLPPDAGFYVSGDLHSERRILERLRNLYGGPNRTCFFIKRLFTERTPCTNGCTQALNNAPGSQGLENYAQPERYPVIWIVEWGATPSELAHRYREIGLPLQAP